MNIDAIVKILKEAGERIIRPALQHIGNVETKADGSMVTRVDTECQQYIREHLQQLAPEIGFMGEEMSLEEQRQCLARQEAFWCLDPLDGTSNLTAGFPVFGTSLALIRDGSPVLACIHDPLRGESFHAEKGGGAWRNGSRLWAAATTNLKTAVGFIDFKRLPEPLAVHVATHRAYHSQRNIGSCALEWAWMASGRAHFIVHGGQKIWDYAAGSLLASEAGCSVGDFEGAPLFRERQMSSPVIAASSAGVHAELLAYIATGRSV